MSKTEIILSDAEAIPDKRMYVAISAPGFSGRFELSEQHFNELLEWLSARACAAKPPGCEKCDRPLVFIRDRNFKDDSGKVWMCENPNCDLFQLYVYPK